MEDSNQFEPSQQYASWKKKKRFFFDSVDTTHVTVM